MPILGKEGRSQQQEQQAQRHGMFHEKQGAQAWLGGSVR